MAQSRRPLKFADFSEVVADAEHLREVGYTALGRWNLAQVCGHLAVWAGFPVSGYPRGNLAVRAAMWATKTTVGRQLARRCIDSGQMAPGLRTMPETVPPADSNEAEMLELLKGALKRFEGHAADYAVSPMLGKLSREDVKVIQLVHCSHHLGFLVPEG